MMYKNKYKSQKKGMNIMGSSIKDVTALGGEVQGFCDNDTRALHSTKKRDDTQALNDLDGKTTNIAIKLFSKYSNSLNNHYCIKKIILKS